MKDISEHLHNAHRELKNVYEYVNERRYEQALHHANEALFMHAIRAKLQAAAPRLRQVSKSTNNSYDRRFGPSKSVLKQAGMSINMTTSWCQPRTVN